MKILGAKLMDHGGDDYRVAKNTFFLREESLFGDHRVTPMEVTRPLPDESDVEHVGAVGRSVVQDKR